MASSRGRASASWQPHWGIDFDELEREDRENALAELHREREDDQVWGSR